MSELHRLARQGDIEGLEEFFETVPDARSLVNEVDDQGGTPLYYALDKTSPNSRVVEILLKNGADPKFAKVDEIPPISDFVDSAADGMSDFAESLGINLNFDKFKGGMRHEQPVIKFALKHGDLEIIRLMQAHGIDLCYEDKNGYTALLDAVHRDNDAPEIIDFLVSQGAPTNTKSSYGETAIVSAYRLSHFGMVERLIEAGTDESPLKWTPLHRAAALGTLDEFEEALHQAQSLEVPDCCDQTALHIVLAKSDEAKFDAMIEKIEDLQKFGPGTPPLLKFAVASGRRTMVKRLIELGCPVDATDYMGDTALKTAAEKGSHALVRDLLNAGADPNIGGWSDGMIDCAKDRKTILALLAGGADPAGLRNEGRRTLLGLGEPKSDELHSCSKEEYLAERYYRPGRSNPEEMSDPFRLAMIRAGGNAYWARQHFHDDPDFGCKIADQADCVWCFERFGQSFTVMPDDRTILIAGEHEDSYDPDFCIYNDVSVFHPDGEIQVFGYPLKTFEPTDFNTATLVDDSIYIIGGLGYTKQRRGPIPVYRLDTTDYSIEKLKTSGDVPSRIFEHRASLLDGTRIRIEGGKAISYKRLKEKHGRNDGVYELDLADLTWTKLG
jgi:ankyrin repeat protein